MRLIDADALMDEQYKKLKDGEVLYRIPPCAIDAAPTINPEDLRPKGKWEHDGQNFKGGVDWWHCSECKKRVAFADTWSFYCPNCGAKMEE